MPFFFEQNMQDVWSLPLACLLVCQGRRYKLVDAADHIGYEWTGRAHGSLADALATLAVQRWLEQWLVAE